MKNIMLELEKIPLTREESLKIEKIHNEVEKKYDISPKKSENLKTLLTNLQKNFKVLKESNSAIVSADVDVFRDIAIIATTKAYTSSIIDQIASVQPLTNPYGYVYYIDFQYGDDFSQENISAGDSLASKRSKKYAKAAEQTKARRIKAQLKSEIINTEVRPLEMSYTLQGYLNIASVLGQEEAKNFLDKRYLEVVQAKLKDEMELTIIDALWDAVPSENEVTYTINSNDATDCINKECHAKRLYQKIDEAAQIVYDKHKVMPNTVIIGTKALNILRQGDVNITTIGADNIPTGIVRNYIGILENKYKVIYDPEVEGVLLFWKDAASDMGATVVYAPYIPLGITAPITERDLTTYRVVYTVDGYKVVHPEFLAKVTLA